MGQDANAPLPNAKRERFCLEYLVDLNATQAAIRSGYSAKTAYSSGQRLLKDVEVAARIAHLQDERARRLQMDADEILRELAVIGRSDIRDFHVDEVGRLTLRAGAAESAWRAVSSVKHRTIRRKDDDEVTHEVEIRLWSKPEALNLAGKHLRMFVDRHEVTGKEGEPLTFTLKLDSPIDADDGDGT